MMTNIKIQLSMAASTLPAAWVSRLSKGVRLLKDGPMGLHALDKGIGIMSHPNNDDKHTKGDKGLRSKFGAAPSGAVRVATKNEDCIFSHAYYDFNQNMYLPKGSLKQTSHLGAGLTEADQRADNEKSASTFIWLLHRLDSATSGVMLVASRKDTAVAVMKLFKTRSGISKTYYALVFDNSHGGGLMAGFQQEWIDEIYLQRDKGQIRAAPTDKSHSRQDIVTAVSTAKLVPTMAKNIVGLKLALIRLSPTTGFTHQLRYQCARRGLPVVGDRTYGSFDLNRRFQEMLTSKRKENEENDKTSGEFDAARLFLHAAKIEVILQNDQGVQENFVADVELPVEFGLALS
jgi:tRNA pseudouridine65 synthase